MAERWEYCFIPQVIGASRMHIPYAVLTVDPKSAVLLAARYKGWYNPTGVEIASSLEALQAS